jgi:phosphoribosyl 1,2-cyclic phosphodiesterase
VRVHLCGVRGSTPVSGREFLDVGGNTSCVALAHDREPTPRLVIDAGTGLREVTGLLGGEPFRGTLLLSHLHWDHTQGLPFFTAIDRPDADARLLLPEQGVAPIELLERFMSPPSFPIGPRQLNGRIQIGTIDEGDHELEGFHVRALEIPHKGGRTLGFRIDDGRSSLAYLSDHGPTGLDDGSPLGPMHRAAVELASGVDLLIHDAQYTASELPRRRHYGHSAADYAVELGRHCGVGQVLLFHHDPGRTDAEVEQMEASFALDRPRVCAARERVMICL